MSYLNQAQDAKRRATAIASVTVIHIIVGAVLVTGLSFTGMIQREGTFIGTFIPDPPKPPPPPPADPAKSEAPTKPDNLTAPIPPVDLSGSVQVDVQPFDPIKIPQPSFTPAPYVVPTPTPSFAPRRAAPRNDPGRWVMTEDYPSRSIREGSEGVASFRLVVGSDGKVDACEITASSGNADLDAATCKYVTRRARFDAATDGNGQKVVGSYSSTVRWVLPR